MPDVRPHYWAVCLLIRALARALGGLRITGRERLPRDHPFLVAVNHISALDPPVLGASLPFECTFFAKVELFRNPLFARLISSLNAIPVRRGEADRVALARARAALRGGRSLVIFPEGTRDRDARLREPKRGHGVLAVQMGVPVVPAYVSGTNRFRHALARRSRIALAFGPPILPPTPAADDPGARRAAYDEVGRAWSSAMRALEAAHADAGPYARPRHCDAPGAVESSSLGIEGSPSPSRSARSRQRTAEAHDAMQEHEVPCFYPGDGPSMARGSGASGRKNSEGVRSSGCALPYLRKTQ
jgi:1-acyl-sn-glycerol-3-phosphate acyltransferase